MPSSERALTLATIRSELAADCGCDVEAFDRFETVVSHSARGEAARRYARPSDPFIVTMGRGVVISVSDSHAEWVHQNLKPMDREAVFSARAIAMLSQYLEPLGSNVYGPELKYACTMEDLGAVKPGRDVELLEGEDIYGLYEFTGFENALQYVREHPQPDVLATVIYADGRPAGIAGASADSDKLWQIGIDVSPEFRGAGMGRALVSRLTEAILEHGRVPYYSTSPSNIGSQRLARSVGFWPAWSELRTRTNGAD